MLTHLDEQKRPTMVDVTHKMISPRMARAQCQVQLPESLRCYLKDQELTLKKGPVFQTAIIAGTMAVKKTSELIPFCHPLPIEACNIQVTCDEQLLVTVRCQVKTTHKTGVEMEALTGATVAALTIYDMCKAVSLEIVLKEAKLLSKTGGKRTLLERPLYGLVLTGGKSSRMGEPKALLNYHGKAHGAWTAELLDSFCEKVFLSAKPGQWDNTELANFPMIFDGDDLGPAGGMLKAFEAHPEVDWLVVACDLPHLSPRTFEELLNHYDPANPVTAFISKEGNFPEALCALYTPLARGIFKTALEQGIRCPVKMVKSAGANLIQPGFDVGLTNINTPEEKLHVGH